jgi:hypothetical protein
MCGRFSHLRISRSRTGGSRTAPKPKIWQRRVFVGALREAPCGGQTLSNHLRVFQLLFLGLIGRKPQFPRLLKIKVFNSFKR